LIFSNILSISSSVLASLSLIGFLSFISLD
jgi:hypothetical protein